MKGEKHYLLIKNNLTIKNMNTQDLSKLGYREIDQLGTMLKVYANNPNDCGLEDGVKWEYNPNSDNLFLVDEDYNVAMLNNNDELEQWHSCGECGNEGFKGHQQTSLCKECKHLFAKLK